MARRGDTKPLCQRAQAGVALIGVSLWSISDGKTLVLCQRGSQRTSLLCSSRRRRGSPVYLGRAVTLGSQTRGEMALLERQGMCCMTTERHSCLAGAPTTR